MESSTAFPVKHKGMITFLVMLATIMEVLDLTIANVAIPHMMGTLSATQDQITWVLTSYVVASAIMMLPTGWLTGRYGRKKIFLISVGGFTIASVLCGASSSLGQMVFFRLLQGASGAALIPMSQAILMDINPKEKHGAAMAMWGIGIMVAPILGPTLGGYFTEYYSWRWIFFINLPVGIICFFGLLKYLSETTLIERPFDLFGFITISLAIGALQLLCDRGEQVDWFASKEIIIYCCIIFSMFWMFIVHSYYSTRPFISIAMLRDRNFVTSLIFIFFVGVVLLATMALIPPYMQNLMGYPVIDVGLLMAPRGMGTMLGMVVVGILDNKVDPRPLILLGLILTIYSLKEMTLFSSFVPSTSIISTGVIQGLGLGLIFVPLSTLAFATIDNKYRDEAAGIFNLTRNIGSSIGISIVSTQLAMSVQKNHAYLAENITPFSIKLLDTIMPASLGNSNILGMLDAEINRQATTLAYINDFSLLMWMVIFIIPMVFLLRNPLKKL